VRDLHLHSLRFVPENERPSITDRWVPDPVRGRGESGAPSLAPFPWHHPAQSMQGSAPASSVAARAASAIRSIGSRAAEGSTSRCVTWPAPTRMGVRSSTMPRVSTRAPELTDLPPYPRLHAGPRGHCPRGDDLPPRKGATFSWRRRALSRILARGEPPSRAQTTQCTKTRTNRLLDWWRRGAAVDRRWP
jgi:hypothetical protein